ncbi:endonuclease/exonuclease/phosphatase family protein [Galbibacter sp. PAP.153]|uniref:endonuclease/exonuclease/phosphatase family protein n=1 Tax=Galbibacter sp. PAP.153 TaxID=3104623 RepID=UPI00300877DE
MNNTLLRTITFILLINSFAIQKTKAQEQTPVKIMTTNIRYENPNDGINIWDNRKDWLCDNINFMDIDILGGQEVIYAQLQDMIERLPAYDHIGIGRNGGNEGEFCPVFYKKDKYALLDSNTFWLSETPEKENSKGWDAALPRIVTWVKLKDKQTGKVFFFFNTHFDHKGKEARLKSAELITKKTKEIAGDIPFFVTGDFNLPPSVKAYSVLTKNNPTGFNLEDTYTRAEKTYGPKYTFNGFKLEPDQDRERIDYIFFHGNVAVLKHQTIDGQRGPNYISDHFPIAVDAIVK